MQDRSHCYSPSIHSRHYAASDYPSDQKGFLARQFLLISLYEAGFSLINILEVASAFRNLHGFRIWLNSKNIAQLMLQTFWAEAKLTLSPTSFKF